MILRQLVLSLARSSVLEACTPVYTTTRERQLKEKVADISK